jgi:hypothetical protein
MRCRDECDFGLFQFLSDMTRVQALWGSSPVDETIQGVYVITTFDKDNNFAVLEASLIVTILRFGLSVRAAGRQTTGDPEV